MRVRRSKKEIDAGFPFNLKAKGVRFEDWLIEQKKLESPKPALADKPKKIIRRSKKEIKEGFPLEDKVKGVKFEDWLLGRDLVKKAKQPLSADEEISQRERPTHKKIVMDIPAETPSKTNVRVIEHTYHTEKVIVEGKNRKELGIMLADLVGKGIYEWKHVPIDDKFRATRLNELGKEGWKFAFILEKTILPSLKFDTISLQRLKI